MPENRNGLHLCDDLIFISRVGGTAQALGLRLHAIKTTADLLQAARSTPPRCVILDLQTPSLVLDTTVRALCQLVPRPFLVGYGSHVDTATLKKARDAGCDLVWPRSKFVEELSSALPQWFQVAEDSV